MPLIDLTIPAGSLDAATRDALMHRLTRTLLRWEGAPESDAALLVSWGYVHEQPATVAYVGGVPSQDQPRFKVGITVPAGALDDERKTGLVAEVTEQVVAAEGSGDPAAAARVWVIVTEIADGNWGGAGQIFRLRDIARLVNAGRAPQAPAVEAALAEA